MFDLSAASGFIVLAGDMPASDELFHEVHERTMGVPSG